MFVSTKLDNLRSPSRMFGKSPIAGFDRNSAAVNGHENLEPAKSEPDVVAHDRVFRNLIDEYWKATGHTRLLPAVRSALSGLVDFPADEQNSCSRSSATKRVAFRRTADAA